MELRKVQFSRRGALRRLIADAAGAVAIEFAFLLPMLVALTVGGIQAGIIFFGQTELSRITNIASRSVMLGNASSLTAAQFHTSLCANIAAIFDCSGLMVSLAPQTSCASITTTPPTLAYDAHGNVTNTFIYNPGTYGDIMVLQVMYLMPVVSGPLFSFSTSNGQVQLVSTLVFKNEPQ